MLNAIIDNLSRLDVLSNYVPTVIQLAVLTIWILIIRISRAKYQASIALSFSLLLLSILAQLLTITLLAKTMAEYAFIFLCIGILQILLSKTD